MILNCIFTTLRSELLMCFLPHFLPKKSISNSYLRHASRILNTYTTVFSVFVSSSCLNFLQIWVFRGFLIQKAWACRDETMSNYKLSLECLQGTSQIMYENLKAFVSYFFSCKCRLRLNRLCTLTKKRLKDRQRTMNQLLSKTHKMEKVIAIISY